MPLSLSNISFAYARRRRLVLDDLSLEFADGATLLLGPNGAGKSTILGLAATTLRARTGSIHIDGVRAAGRQLRAYRRSLAWMPQDVQVVPGLTVREQVAYVGWLKGLRKKDAWHRAEGALDRVSLSALADERPDRLSGGERRRLGVAQVLVHDATWMLMDEPTAGLDPLQRADFHVLVASLRHEINLVISTHQTEDIDSSYDNVVVIDGGQIRFDDSAAAFLALGASQASVSEAVIDAYRRTIAAI